MKEAWPGLFQRWGIYEKALPAESTWPEKLATAARAGYQFIELSMDESEERLARLEWTGGPRREMRRALADSPVSIDTMCLSAHRKHALGSQSEPVRQRALAIMRKAIDLAAELGIRIIQVAGYDVHYEESTERTRALYGESIVQAAEWARSACVMLALENVDCPFIDSIEKGMRFVRSVDTPWFQLYPDIGNLAAVGRDVQSELRAGGRHIVGVHVKDTRAQEFRRVPLGQGCVDFEVAFRTLKEIDFRGPFTVEMWNVAAVDPTAVITEARRWLGAKVDSVAAGSR
jgi:L-ribulose-5-phosphate 3-epimerase